MSLSEQLLARSLTEAQAATRAQAETYARYSRLAASKRQLDAATDTEALAWAQVRAQVGQLHRQLERARTSAAKLGPVKVLHAHLGDTDLSALNAVELWEQLDQVLTE